MAAQLYTDEESFLARLREEAASIPDPEALARLRKPAPPSTSVATSIGDCPKCQGRGRFISRYGRDVGECFRCNGTGRGGPAVSAYPTTAATTPTAPLDLQCPNLRAVFDKFLARGEKRAQLTSGRLNISLAGPHGKNPGTLYVSWDGAYGGKIIRDTFYPRISSPDMLAALILVEADPRAAVEAEAKRAADAIADGERMGKQVIIPCGVCGIYLTDPISRSRGIGPICAARWGLFGLTPPADPLALDDL